MGTYADELTGWSVWEPYRMADCGQPDGPESPGNRFLGDVRDDCIEHIRTDDATPGTLRDKAGELAGQAVYDLESRGTYRKWLAFADLCGWQEDLGEYGWQYDGETRDLNNAADLALQMIAERLISAIADEWEESVTDGDDDCQEPDSPVPDTKVDTAEILTVCANCGHIGPEPDTCGNCGHGHGQPAHWH